MVDMNTNEHVVILGAGPAGLATGHELSVSGVKVSVLDRNDFVGGLCNTNNYKGYKFDLGGHRWFSKNEDLNDWFRRLMGDEVVWVQRISRIYYDGGYYLYPISILNVIKNAGIPTIIHAGITYINYGDFDGYDTQANATNSFSGSEVAISLGHARNIPFTNFHYGGTIKFISSQLEQYSSFGIAADLGIMYVHEDWDLQITGVARNIGTQLTPYDIDLEPLPFEIILGASQILERIPIRWHFTLENMQRWDLAFSNPDRETTDLEGVVTTENINFIDEAFRHVILGIELFPESGFNIRFGYNFRRAEELRIIDTRAFSGLSAGFGIKLNKVRLNYSFSKYNTAASSSFFGLNIDLQ